MKNKKLLDHFWKNVHQIQNSDCSFTVELMSSDSQIGYIPEKDNAVFARLMDAGKMLMARVSKIDKKGSFMQITIGIYLVDF